MNRLERDPRLAARVLRRFEVAYAEGASVDEDRPAFVRAASGIAWVGDELAIVQDDASFIAIGRPGELFRSIALPRGPGGRRRFEVALGNKYDKLDLETCVARGERLLAFGSGSLPVREQIASLSMSDGRAVMIDAAPFYAELRSAPDFAGGQLNVEGAAIVGDVLRLFQRSNGRHGGHPASVDVGLGAFLSWLDGTGPVPALENARTYDLGEVRGVRFGFTDACEFGDAVVFVASAEASPNAVDDGELLGSLLGVFDDSSGRWAPLCDERGGTSNMKAEGIAIHHQHADRAWVVIDPDDPNQPAELCEVGLEGPWL
ncbi:MAG TPA: hypothetical protein VFB62_15175 [Polyangiaceae bacterium]|jgi:hypothetical protein|nr:hypothetical protein [Polyangiaceae bacterium]